MIGRLISLLIMLCVLSGYSVAAESAASMPGVFSDNMVLQRDKPVAVWGWTTPGEKITVTFAGNKQTATADAQGKWTVKLPAMKATKTGRTLTAASSDGKKQWTFKNVLVGEVWFCTGGANIHYSMRDTKQFKRARRDSKNTLVRVYNAPRANLPFPARTIAGQWTTVNSSNLSRISGVAYYFAERLYNELDVPVGVIISTGSPIQSMLRSQTLDTLKGTPAEKIPSPLTPEETRAEIEAVRQWINSTEAALANGEDVPPYPLPREKNQKYRSGMFNSMVAPLIPYTIRGILCYQGEHNPHDGRVYRELSEALIASWRKLWGEELPFYSVQLPPCLRRYVGPELPLLWEAQTATLRLPKTGLVGTADVTELYTTRPGYKSPVGNRLALWALANEYGKKELIYSGPMFNHVTFNGNQAVATFDHAGAGLESRDGKPLTHLMIAGKDKEFFNATAKIQGDTLILTSTDVAKPVAVRYGWSQGATPNLCNSAGLPAIAFRTDSWDPGILACPRLGRWSVYSGSWEKDGGVYKTENLGTHWAKDHQLSLGYQPWTTYMVECDARRTGKQGGWFYLYFGVQRDGHYYVLKANEKELILVTSKNRNRVSTVKAATENGTWARLKLVVNGRTAEVFLNGKSVMKYTAPKEAPSMSGGIGIGGYRIDTEWRNVRVADLKTGQ